MSHFKLNLDLAVPRYSGRAGRDVPATNVDAGSDALLALDRRTTLKWLGAVMLAAKVELASPASRLTPKSTGKSAGARGYGGDPDLRQPSVPWPRTLSQEQLLIVARLCDVLLPDDGRSPAASAVGVHEFVDEWVSAPYQEQQQDRAIILRGIDWIASWTAARSAKPFHQAPRELQVELFEQLVEQQQAGESKSEVAAFLPRLRYIAVGAYYTTEAGIADLGHIGNQPMAGDYPGPTPQALEHLQQVLRRLGLSL